VRLCTNTFVSRHFVPTPDAQLCVCRCCRGHVPSGAHQVHRCVACLCLLLLALRSRKTQHHLALADAPVLRCAAAERFCLDPDAVLSNVRRCLCCVCVSARCDANIVADSRCRGRAQIIWARVYTADALIEALVNVRRRIRACRLSAPLVSRVGIALTRARPADTHRRWRRSSRSSRSRRAQRPACFNLASFACVRCCITTDRLRSRSCSCWWWTR
jgi:hypothetical protein